MALHDLLPELHETNKEIRFFFPLKGSKHTRADCKGYGQGNLTKRERLQKEYWNTGILEYCASSMHLGLSETFLEERVEV